MSKPRGWTFEPLTADRWNDFEALFGPRGAVGGCWCMWWRVAKRADWTDNKGAGNRRAVMRRSLRPARR
jgi:hypothetical protein